MSLFIHSFNQLIDSISKYNPACDRHCARCWEYRGTQCLSLNDIPPASYSAEEYARRAGVGPCNLALLHLSGAATCWTFSSLQHLTRRLPFPSLHVGPGTFPHECTFPLPLHQHHGGTSLNSSRLASSLPADVFSHLPDVPRAIASFLSLPQSFASELLLEGFSLQFSSPLVRVRVSRQDPGSVCLSCLTWAGRGQRPLQQTLRYRGAVSWVGVVYLHPHEQSGPLGCFRMLSRSQGSGD